MIRRLEASRVITSALNLSVHHNCRKDLPLWNITNLNTAVRYQADFNAAKAIIVQRRTTQKDSGVERGPLITSAIFVSINSRLADAHNPL